MLGPIVNGVAIVLCSMIGLILAKLLKKMNLVRFQEIIMKALGLAVLYIGLSGALKDQRALILIFSLIVGAIIGELLNIDKAMNNLGKWAEQKLGFGEGNFAKGFVSASILYCTGSMAIVGALNSGLMGDHQMLFAKSILDGVTAIVFTYELGIGVAFSSLPVLFFEGVIVLSAMFVKDWLTDEIITEMSAVGGLIIVAIGLNFLGVKEIKAANLIPAIFLPWVFLGIEGLIFT